MNLIIWNFEFPSKLTTLNQKENLSSFEFYRRKNFFVANTGIPVERFFFLQKKSSDWKSSNKKVFNLLKD